MDGAEGWYPESDIFNDKPMTEGAGQQRAISRLALDYSIREGKLTPLFDVIQELNELTMDESNQQMRFYIISSLAGGTGSGLILPLALYLKKFVFDECGDNLSICKGFFVLSSALRRNVGTRLEQKSLDSNAYAAVKELHAFMQAADNRKGRYSDIAMTLAGDNELSQSSSYEYCYLFGIANERGKRMHSFEELKQLVAQAVNMQACSPIHDRNSSREDNTIKHITYQMLEQGKDSLSRFGGIGCGELVYPYDTLKGYYALQWAMEVMDKAWQEYDQNYYAKQKEQIEDKKLGKKGNPISRGTEYVNSVLLADHVDTFAENIRSSCTQQDGTESWDGYLDALAERISQQVDERRKERENDFSSTDIFFLDNIDEMMRPGYRAKARIASRNQVVWIFKQLKKEILAITAQFQGYQETYFFDMHPVGADMEPFWMEYWLQKEGEFIHPNAVRYFLYRLIKALEEKIPEMEKKLEEGKSKCEACDEKEEWTKWGDKLNPNFKAERDVYGSTYEALYQYVKDQIYMRVLKHCKAYAERLAKNYEEFYDSIREMLEVFEEQRKMLEMELDRTTGISRSYVCADAQCRRKIFEEIKQRPEFYRITSALSRRIYELIHAPAGDRLQRKQRFRQIEQYWEDDLEKNYADMLDMNILHALDKEEMCKSGRHMTAEEMANRIEQVRKTLIEPFVQYYKVAGEEQGISICCYNSILEEEHGEYLEVARWLRQHEGVDDDVYCDSRCVMFYRSFVGLDVGKVLEYLHWDRKSRFKGAGRAFRYYEQTLLDMGKARDGNSQITPHIDKSWHSLLELPDTDSSYQSRAEIEAAIVLLYGVLSQAISREPSDHKYKFAQGGYSLRFDTLSEAHQYLYYNAQVRKQIADQLERRIDEDGREGTSVTLNRIKDYEGGIYQILMDYNRELPLGLQDEVVNTYLVLAVSELVERCMRGDLKDPQGKKLEILQEAWQRQKAKRTNADGTGRQNQRGDNDGYDSRLEMITTIIENYFQSARHN